MLFIQSCLLAMGFTLWGSIVSSVIPSSKKKELTSEQTYAHTRKPARYNLMSLIVGLLRILTNPILFIIVTVSTTIYLATQSSSWEWVMVALATLVSIVLCIAERKDHNTPLPQEYNIQKVDNK